MPAIGNHVLIAEHDPALVRLMQTVLEPRYVVRTASTAAEAMACVELAPPDLVIIESELADGCGLELSRQIKNCPAGDSADIILMTSACNRASVQAAYSAGAEDVLSKPFQPWEMRTRVDLVFRLRQARATLESCQELLDRQAKSSWQNAVNRYKDLVATQDVAVFTMAKVAESRDQETGNHLLRMRAYSQVLTQHLARSGPYIQQIDEQFQQDLFRSSPLHDIGKVGISDSILLKPGRLTPDEFEVMKTHTVIGANILDQAVWNSPSGTFLAMAATIARYHHERFDGSGYPTSLKGHNIPLPARIVALADVFDALTSERPYKRAFPTALAKEMIVAESGKHFDPMVVDAFLKEFDSFLAIRRRYHESDTTATGAISFDVNNTWSPSLVPSTPA